MKIIAGSLKGKTLKVIPSVRPITEKNRAAIMNVLGNRLSSATVLDLFCGSGALAFESISRGANIATLVDKSSVVVSQLRKASRELKIADKVVINKLSSQAFIKDHTTKYDIIFIDPPYDEFNISLVTGASELLAKDGVMVVSTSKNYDFSDTIGRLKCAKQSIYGDTQIVYLVNRN